MGLIQRLIQARHNKIRNSNLFYGYLGEFEINTQTLNGETFTDYIYNIDNLQGLVIMQRLTERERTHYLKTLYSTFIDSEDCQLYEYLSIKNSDIQFYRLVSKNNRIIPCTTSIRSAHLIAPCEATIKVEPLSSDFNLDEKFLTIQQIKNLETQLNQHSNQTCYYKS